MPDTTLDALRLAVLADPQDDSCRLILADALDEAGDCDYAEFIRVQCALARLPDDAEGCFCASKEPGFLCAPCLDLGRRRDALRHREQELWGHYPLEPAGSGWTILPESVGVGPDPPFASVRRGFVAEVRCTLSDWVRHGPDVVRKHPVEHVEVTDSRPWNADGRRWGWSKNPHEAVRKPWILPAEVFDLLDTRDVVRPPAQLPLPQFPHRRWYDSESLAFTRLGQACLLYARLQSWPCPACDGNGKVWKDIGLKGGPERGPEIRYVCPPPQQLLFDCDACQGQGWKIAP